MDDEYYRCFSKMKHIKKSIVVFCVTISLCGLYIAFQPNAEAAGLEAYCSNGYYKLPNEKESCSRAPCCGISSCSESEYDWVANLPMPNPQECMGDGESGRKNKGCAGYVPLCCYEMARTGKFVKCVGYWERLWCTPSQCSEAKKNGASDSECGGTCQCAHAFSSYCGDKPPIPLEQRLGGLIVPTTPQQPTSIPVKPTSLPIIPTTQPFVPPVIIIPTEVIVPTNIPPIYIPPESTIQNPLSPETPPLEPSIQTPLGIDAFIPKPESVIAVAVQALEYPRSAINELIRVDKEVEEWFDPLILWLNNRYQEIVVYFVK